MSLSSETPTFPELPKLSKVLDTVAQIGAFNPHDGAGYELRKLRWYRDALFERFAPFKAGDRVVMHTAYPITAERCSGWLGYEGMMQPGASGTVTAVDWVSREIWNKDAEPGDGFFSVSVMFDQEWRISSFRGERYDYPADKRHVFNFGNPERYWRKGEPEPPCEPEVEPYLTEVV